MKTLHFCDLTAANVLRCEAVFHRLRDWSPTDWACAMAGECGEACNEIKKLRRLDGAAMPATIESYLNRIGEELADMVIYADLLAARLKIDLGHSIIAKFNKTSEQHKSPITLRETDEGLELSGELFEVKRQLKHAEEILERLHYRRCDIPSCNCGGYHQQSPITETDLRELWVQALQRTDLRPLRGK